MMTFEHLTIAELEVLEERFLKTSLAMLLSGHKSLSDEMLVLSDAVLAERLRKAGGVG